MTSTCAIALDLTFSSNPFAASRRVRIPEKMSKAKPAQKNAAITIVVPNGRGIVIEGPAATGGYAGDVNIQWWRTQIRNLNASLGYIDPTHLPI